MKGPKSLKTSMYLSCTKCFPRGCVWGGGGGEGYCFSVGVGQQRGSIYLFMILEPLSSVIEIKDLGIRQPNQSLP